MGRYITFIINTLLLKHAIETAHKREHHIFDLLDKEDQIITIMKKTQRKHHQHETNRVTENN